MSKPVRLFVLALGVLALLAILGVMALRGRRPSPMPEPAAAKPHAEIPPTPRAPAGKPTPSVPLSLPAAAKPNTPAASDDTDLLGEAELLAKIKKTGPSNLSLALSLARQGAARFPDSPNAPEFHMNIARSLLRMGRLEAARSEARLMLEKYPGNHFTLDVAHHLLRNTSTP